MRWENLHLTRLFLAVILLTTAISASSPEKTEDHMRMRALKDEEEQRMINEYMRRPPEPFYEDPFFLFCTFVIMLFLGMFCGKH